MKAGSLHTACGLPQVAHRICPERVVLSRVKLIHQEVLRSSLLAHIMAPLGGIEVLISYLS